MTMKLKVGPMGSSQFFRQLEATCDHFESSIRNELNKFNFSLTAVRFSPTNDYLSYDWK